MSSTLRRFKPSFKAFLGVAGLIATVGGAILYTVFAAASNLYLSPGTGSFQQDSSLSLALRVNSDGSVTSVQANLSYPADKLQFLSISDNGSAFNLSNQSSGGDGSVVISRSSLLPVSGDNLVATINFKVLTGSGNAAVNFASGSTISTGLGGSSTTTTNGNYTLTSPPATGGGGGSSGGSQTTTNTTTAQASGGSPMLAPTGSKPKVAAPSTNTSQPTPSTPATQEEPASEQTPTSSEISQNLAGPLTNTSSKTNKLAFSAPQKRAIALTVMGSGLSSLAATMFMVLRRRGGFSFGSLFRSKKRSNITHDAIGASADNSVAATPLVAQSVQQAHTEATSVPIEQPRVAPAQPVVAEVTPEPVIPPIEQTVPVIENTPVPEVPAQVEVPEPAAVSTRSAPPIVATRAKILTTPAPRNPVFLQPTYRVHSPSSISSGATNNYTRTH